MSGRRGCGRGNGSTFVDMKPYALVAENHPTRILT